MEALVYNTLARIYAEKDDGKRQVLKDESNAALAAHFSHPANASDLQELAFDLLNLAWADAMNEDIVGRIIEVKTVGLGDPDYIDEDLRGMRAYWQGKGGQILSDVLRYERHQMPREEMVWAIDQHVDELALNFWGPIEKLRSQANEKLRQLPTTRLVELIQAAITSGVYYGTFAATTLTGAQVRSVVEQVSAKSGGSATIIGTELGVRYLSRVGLEYSDEARNQILHTGMIGVFEGWPVAQIENFEDFAGNFVLPNNELWIVGKKAGRLTYYGGVKGQVLSMTAFRRRWETARDAGMLLYGADERHGRLGRIVLT
jgi:hypothetical protein